MIKVKKVIVASFQRSGTHFLINNLATNFQGIQDGWVDLLNKAIQRSLDKTQPMDLRKRIWEQLCAYHLSPLRRCLKTHFQMYFFETRLAAIFEKYDVLYVVRDPRDTLVACYHYYNCTGFEPFIKEPVFSKFLRADLSQVKTETSPFSYSYVKPRNIVDKWNNHVLSWLPYKDKGVPFVKFSDLKDHWPTTLQSIQANTSQQLKPNVQPIPLTDQRVRPDFKREGYRRGEVGNWREYFSRDDLQFVDQTLSEEVKQFLDP